MLMRRGFVGAVGTSRRAARSRPARPATRFARAAASRTSSLHGRTGHRLDPAEARTKPIDLQAHRGKRLADIGRLLGLQLAEIINDSANRRLDGGLWKLAHLSI
jgi:hypothetical protein